MAITSAPASPDLAYATQVGYATARTTASYRVVLRCVATDPSVRGQIAYGEAAEDDDGSMLGSLRTDPQRSAEGSIVQVGDRRIEYKPRSEQQNTDNSTFTVVISSSGPGTYVTAHVVWALWGSSANCTVTINDVSIEVRYFEGERAFYAGPEAFTGGTFYQDDQTPASVARVFTTPLSGGPVFAHIEPGSRTSGFGQAFIGADDFYLLPAHECRQPYGGECGITRPRGARLVAGITAAYESDGGYQGELWVVNPPPLDPE